MVLLHHCSAAVAESAAISKISRIIGAFYIYKFSVPESGASGWVISPFGADTAQAGGIGHMIIEKAGCPQPPPACLGFGVEVGTFGTGIGSGSGNAGSDGIKQIFRLCPAENEDPIEGAFTAGGLGNVVRRILVGHCENLRLLLRGTLLINKALPKQMRHSFALHFWCFHDTR